MEPPPELTKFERAKVLGLRAQQLMRGAPATVDPRGESDPLRIALMELVERKIPMMVRRRSPDGTVAEYRISDMIIHFDQ